MKNVIETPNSSHFIWPHSVTACTYASFSWRYENMKANQVVEESGGSTEHPWDIKWSKKYRGIKLSLSFIICQMDTALTQFQPTSPHWQLHLSVKTQSGAQKNGADSEGMALKWLVPRVWLLPVVTDLVHGQHDNINVVQQCSLLHVFPQDHADWLIQTVEHRHQNELWKKWTDHGFRSNGIEEHSNGNNVLCESHLSNSVK